MAPEFSPNRSSRTLARRHRVIAQAILASMLLTVGASAFLGCAASVDPNAPPRHTESSQTPWVDIRQALGYNWSGLIARLPNEVDRIDRVLRNRAVYRIEGFGFGHLMLGPGALYPYHSHASPEAYHVLSGEAEWSVDGETRRVVPGTTIYHAPYADHRWVTTSEEPLRVIWAQWAPDGDRSGLIADGVRRRGGGVTGNFFVGERRSRSALITELAVPFGEPSPGSAVAELRTARLAAREAESSRPAIRAFVDSVGVPWNTDLLGVRWRSVFGTPDLEWGHVRIVGPGEREIPAGATPGLLHVLSGRAEIRVADDSGISVATGSTLAFQPGEPIEIDFGEQGASAELRAIWVRWAPNPDLDYWGRDYFLVEPMPEPPPEAELARDVLFFGAD